MIFRIDFTLIETEDIVKEYILRAHPELETVGTMKVDLSGYGTTRVTIGSIDSED